MECVAGAHVMKIDLQSIGISHTFQPTLLHLHVVGEGLIKETWPFIGWKMLKYQALGKNDD